MRYHLLTLFLVLKKVICCGYDSCTEAKKGVLNVHIVPHSHNDVGWVSTFDQYYTRQVRFILDSVVKELWKDPKRKFMYVETAFFWRWWNEQAEDVKNQVNKLVREGRFKFVGGAWTMNDEATTHYQSIIDQFTWGLKKINETFGPCARPIIAWQIDPFGHSREFASLLAAMGYDGLFICRIDSRELMERRKTKTMELIWRGDDDLGSTSDIFTGILYDHYTSPEGFDFEKKENSMFVNTDKKVDDFFNYILNVSKTYATNNILIAMGGDFAYSDARFWFENLDILIELSKIKAAKDNFNINIFYSTPDCYLNAIVDANPTFPLKRDDFFPYANDYGYWTGFYTSRPTLKYFERESNRYFQMVKQLYVIAGLNDDKDSVFIDELRSAMGILQHHDAISGTEKEHVAANYKKILNQALYDSLTVADKAFSKFSGYYSDDILYFEKCQLNQSECVISETSKNFIVTIYNPLAWELSDVDVIVPIPNKKFNVFDSDGNITSFKIFPILEWYKKSIRKRKSIATHELIFKAKNVKPLGYKSFYIQQFKYRSNESSYISLYEKYNHDVEYNIFEYASSIISSIGNGYYHSTRSGAYVFSPNTMIPTIWSNLTLNDLFKITKNKETKVTPVIQKLKKYRNSVILQIKWLCDPISLSDPNGGKEVVVIYETNVANGKKYYTDSNGRQTIERKLLKRWEFDNPNRKHVAGNYYPITNKIYIKDNNTRFTIITDRAQGGYSPRAGTIELMINRRLVFHKNELALGLDEPLDEGPLAIVVDNFIVISEIGNKQSIIDEKTFNFEVNLSPIFLFSDASRITLDIWLKMKNSNKGLKRDFPEGLHLLTLEPWNKGQLLLRLENYLDGSDKNNVIDVDVCNIFTTFTLTSMRETNLAANQWLHYNKQRKNNNVDIVVSMNGYRLKTKAKRSRTMNSNCYNKCSKIKLYPKEIRTFIADYKIKASFFKQNKK